MNEYELLNQLYFERVSGSENELKACQLIQNELTKIGLKSHIEAFDVTQNHVEKVRLEVLEPYQKTYEATAYNGCINADMEAEFYYFEQDNEVCRKQAENKIVLVNGYLNTKTFKAITEAKASGFITFNGHIDKSDNDLDPRELRATLQDFGNIAGVNIRVNDAMEMIERQASKIHMVVEQSMEIVHSHNLICDIEGRNEEKIVCTAHYDSVPHSKGAYDNATGSVCLYALAKQLKDKPLNYSIRLIWCGSEERGLLGSKAYVHAHQEELEKIKLCVNVDMIGSIMGRNIAVCTSDISLVHFIEYYSKMHGFSIEASQGVYSSDSTPFADAGVPAVSFARISAAGTGDIHSRYDVMEHLSAAKLEKDCAYINGFVEEMANAFIIPVPKEMPQNMKEELDKYLCRDLKERKQELD